MNAKFLRSFANLIEQVGEERVAELVNPRHTAEVRGFCNRLINDSTPLGSMEQFIGHSRYLFAGPPSKEECTVGQYLAMFPPQQNPWSDRGQYASSLQDAESILQCSNDISHRLGKIVMLFPNALEYDYGPDLSCPTFWALRFDTNCGWHLVTVQFMDKWEENYRIVFRLS
jgi:hypothetical protein